ncbi:hypothetical protein DAEQUDRAFT_720291 [Daedalea quercina L-15889]|uniref:Uncharacterized protein n=1 Tax=Daedalea quercina L-15889 TaxID=1314783 RepID=A0A165UL40_9APHY|nr:hypothetical protein DAEQUDRAFT_720291 [Daedalea quercina L-15889]
MRIAKDRRQEGPPTDRSTTRRGSTCKKFALLEARPIVMKLEAAAYGMYSPVPIAPAMQMVAIPCVRSVCYTSYGTSYHGQPDLPRRYYCVHKHHDKYSISGTGRTPPCHFRIGICCLGGGNTEITVLSTRGLAAHALEGTLVGKALPECMIQCTPECIKQSLVPSDNVGRFLGVMVAFPVCHKTVAIGKQSVALIKRTDVYRCLAGISYPSQASVQLVRSSRHILKCRN